MSFKSHIVASGGYSVREFTGRPKFRLFSFIALLWLPVACLASLPLWTAPVQEFVQFLSPYPRQAGYLWTAFADHVGEAPWLYWLLVLMEPVFIGFALLFRITEERRRVVEHHVHLHSAA